MAKCVKPGCPRTGKPANRRLCYAHYALFQKQRIEGGEWRGFVPAAPVIEHMRLLKQSGISVKRLAVMTGLGESTLQKVPTRKRLWASIAEKILEVSPLDMLGFETSGLTPATGTARRVRALIAMGHTQRSIAAATGRTQEWLTALINDRRPQVQVSTAKRVAELFDSWQSQPPKPGRASTMARNRARRLGWPLPLAWDEDSIDDPTATPVILNDKYDWINEYDDLIELGYNLKQASEKLNISIDTIQKRLQRRAGRNELAA